MQDIAFPLYVVVVPESRGYRVAEVIHEDGERAAAMFTSQDTAGSACNDRPFSSVIKISNRKALLAHLEAIEGSGPSWLVLDPFTTAQRAGIYSISRARQILGTGKLSLGQAE